MNIKINDKKIIFAKKNKIKIIIFFIINIIIYTLYKKKIYNIDTFILICTIINSIILLNNYIIHSVLFLKTVHQEIKKIHWPKITETIQITILIFCASIVVSFVFWILDRIIFYLISLMINLRF